MQCYLYYCCFPQIKEAVALLYFLIVTKHLLYHFFIFSLIIFCLHFPHFVGRMGNRLVLFCATNDDLEGMVGR